MRVLNGHLGGRQVLLVEKSEKYAETRVSMSDFRYEILSMNIGVYLVNCRVWD